MKKFEIISSLLIAGKLPREIRNLHPEIIPSKISKIRKKLGLPQFSRGFGKGFCSPKSMQLRSKILNMRKHGMTFQKIGDEVGLTKQRAHQISVLK